MTHIIIALLFCVALLASGASSLVFLDSLISKIDPEHSNTDATLDMRSVGLGKASLLLIACTIVLILAGMGLV